MSFSDPQPHKLRTVLPKFNRMYQNVKVMIAAIDCSNIKVDVATRNAYHNEFETSVNEWFCIISKLGCSSFEDLALEIIMFLLLLPFFVSHLATAYHSN